MEMWPWADIEDIDADSSIGCGTDNPSLSVPRFAPARRPFANPSSAVRPNGEKDFRGERFFVRARFRGKRYRAAHVVSKMQHKKATICLSTIAVLELRNSG
jgi:hypothetical protein